mgnify:CR=1 FL=1
MDKIKIGYAPTRRSIFSAPDAVKYRGLTAERFTERDRNYAMCSKRTVNDEGIPVVCETDIHGAITSLMVEAAGMGESRSFLRTGRSVILTIQMVSCFSTVTMADLNRKGKSKAYLSTCI